MRDVALAAKQVSSIVTMSTCAYQSMCPTVLVKSST